jgi:hypothetical protein
MIWLFVTRWRGTMDILGPDMRTRCPCRLSMHFPTANMGRSIGVVLLHEQVTIWLVHNRKAGFYPRLM